MAFGSLAATCAARQSQGPVQGVDDGRVSRFLGIPFAAPPLGDLRFRPAAPAPVHEGTLTATAYGPACPQLDAPRGLLMSEDCLTLNVFRPDGDKAPKPVLVFLYGGSFKYGTAAPEPAPAGPNYDGGAIAAHRRHRRDPELPHWRTRIPSGEGDRRRRSARRVR